jgi:glycogen debranching enzyme
MNVLSRIDTIIPVIFIQVRRRHTFLSIFSEEIWANARDAWRWRLTVAKPAGFARDFAPRTVSRRGKA